MLRGGAGGPSTRWWEGWAPQRTPHRVSTICGRGSCAAKRRGWQVISRVEASHQQCWPRSSGSCARAHPSSRPLRRVQEGALALNRKGPTGEVPCPPRVSWGGRRALNALVGGGGHPSACPYGVPTSGGRDSCVGMTHGGGRPYEATLGASNQLPKATASVPCEIFSEKISHGIAPAPGRPSTVGDGAGEA